MLCERCKIREANIRYTEVVGGVATEHNLCSHCAKEMDFGQYTGLASLFDTDYPIGKLLSQLLGLKGGQETEQAEELASLVCPTCQTSYGDFVKDSQFGCPDCYHMFDLLISDKLKQFGCPDCYHMFDLLISDKLKQLHGSDTHTGHKPAGMAAQAGEDILERPLSKEEQRELLRSKLQEAVAEEDYEAAAMYRDEIRALEKQLKKSASACAENVGAGGEKQ